MKRVYRPYRDHYRLPLDAIDFWMMFICTFAFLIYVAWRWV